MSKECEPSTASISKDNSRVTMALVDEKATVITVCHHCGVLYSAVKTDFVTAAVAERTAWDHGNSFSLGHHVSVVSGESPTSLRETLVVNENPKVKPIPSLRQPFFIP